MRSKKELIFDVLDRKRTGYIPVIPTSITLAISRSPYSIDVLKSDPKKFVEASINSRREYGYDGLFSGNFQGVTAAIGGGLVDKHGKISVTGDGTIQNPEDMEKIKEFDVHNSPSLDFLVEVIKEMKKQEPNEPIFTIMDNPPMVAAALMDGENYYYHMIKNPEFVHKLTEYVFEPLVESAKVLLDAGTDIMWLPMPTIGGTCISRDQYEEFCLSYNKRFNKTIRDNDSYLILHTCGNWNDRFDLAVTEGAQGLHVAEADLSLLKKEHGDKVCIMGQIPTVSCMVESSPEEVYEESLKECLIGAKGGGFILSPDCGVPGKTPEDNIKAMIKASKDAIEELDGNC